MAGLNLATLSGYYEGNYRPCFGVGVAIHYTLSEHIAVSSGLIYLQKGAGIPDEEVKLSYLELPVMFKYIFGTRNRSPYFVAGPTIAVNLNAEFEAYGDTYDMEIKSFDWGLSLGGGMSIPIGNNSIFVETRFALGLTNISDGDDYLVGDTKTRGVQLFSGIMF